MTELKTEFEGRGEVRGYFFKQIKRTDYAYLYEKTSETGFLSYEVFKRKENELYQTVSYPSSKSFGIWAWELPTKEKALEKMEKLHYYELNKALKV